MSAKSATTLPLRLDPAYGDKSRQLHAALRQAILAGLLSPGARLASSRELARQLKLGRNIVVAAYEQLLNDGLISARQGSGSFIADILPGTNRREAKSKLALAPDRPRPFVLGHSGGDPGLLAHLGRALSEAAKSAKPGDLAYGDPRGHPALREEIARFLAVSRGIPADPDQVFVMGGVQPALRLAAEALLRRGDKIWFEDPGYPAAAMTLQAAGLVLIPVPVDGEGIDVVAGRRRWAKARAAYVTPSHQFPLGVTLSMARRTALLEWARDQGAYLLEDDYDSEFRYDGPPLTALAGLDAERVIYIGTFTKTLFAGLRLAYLVAPPDVVAKLAMARATLDRFPASLPQIALARLMAKGDLARHVRRMRQLYGEARSLLAATLSSEGEGLLQVIAPTQGLHLLALLPKAWPKGSAEEIRRAAGIAARLLSETRLTPRKGDGFILGFSGYEPEEIVAGAKALARATRLYAKARGAN